MNTIRIAKLCLRDIDIRQYPLESIECASWLEESALLFPSHSSQALPKDHTGPLCILDATWPKAMGMYLSTPILRERPCFHLPYPPTGSYLIRKAPDKISLSSLEAIAAVLEYLEKETASPKPLYDAFHARIAMQIKHIPDAIFQKNYST